MKDRPLRTEPDAKTDNLARAVIGATIEVHREQGPGFDEKIYQRSLEIELRRRGIPFEPKKRVKVKYKGELVGEGELDILVGGCLVVELKAVQAFAQIHTAQVISYLKATRLTLGLLINFNVVRLKEGIRRVVLSPGEEL